MQKLKTYLGAAVGLVVLAVVVNLLSARHVVAQALRDVIVVNGPGRPIPTDVQTLPPITGSVAITGTPAVTGSVAITNTPTVRMAGRTLVNDGRSFALSPDPNIAFELSVPPDVVLTDVVLSLNAPSLSTTVFVADLGSSKTYVFESVGTPGSAFAGNSTGRSAIHLQSGLQTAAGLRVGVYCPNIGGNSCSGALMWSGYQN